MNNSTIIIIVIGCVLLATVGIYKGFNEKVVYEYNVKKEGNSYIKAEYSEQDCGIDFDGEYSCDTDYWSEVVSEEWQFIAVDGKLQGSNIPQSNLDTRFNIIGYPQITVAHPKRSFDRYSKRKYYNYGMYVLNKWRSIDEEEYNTLLANLGEEKPVKVKFWYGMIRGIEQ